MPGDDYYFDLPPAEYAAELQKPSFFEVNKTKCVIALVVVVGVVFGVIICQAINGSAFSNTKKVSPSVSSSAPETAAPVAAATPVESFTPKKNKARRNKNKNKKRKHESAVNIIRHEEEDQFMGKRKKKRSKK